MSVVRFRSEAPLENSKLVRATGFFRCRCALEFCGTSDTDFFVNRVTRCRKIFSSQARKFFRLQENFFPRLQFVMKCVTLRSVTSFEKWKVFRPDAVTPFIQNIFQNEGSASTQQTHDFSETHMTNFFGNAIENRRFANLFPKARFSWRWHVPFEACCCNTTHTVYGFETSRCYRRKPAISPVATPLIPFTVLKQHAGLVLLFDLFAVATPLIPFTVLKPWRNSCRTVRRTTCCNTTHTVYGFETSKRTVYRREYRYCCNTTHTVYGFETHR